jgi:CubicO group peptidase (beta-lactamase class C family)
MFTATMIFQLIDEGKLKLTDTLDKFFPQVPNAGKINIAQILAHRSGIHDVLLDKDLRPSSKTNPITREELLTLIASGTPDFEPDQKHSYSNSGYALLGLILEKITGKTYGEALEERISSKIGLKDTYPNTGNMDVNKNEALGYRYLGEWKQEPETHPSILFGAGSIISTPNDMARFIRGLFDLKFVSQESLNQMKTIRDGEGLGMVPFTFAGKIFYGETGGANILGAWLAYLPEEKLAVAYTTNAKVYPVVNIMNGVIDIYYNRPFQIPAFESIAISPEVLNKYVGVYSNPQAPFKFIVTREDATIIIQPSGQSAFLLEATAEDKFRIEGTGLSFEFDTSKNLMIQKRDDRELVWTRENQESQP